MLNAILRWILGPPPYDTADGQKHWDETADALARIEEDNEVLDPGVLRPRRRAEPVCLNCRRSNCTEHPRKETS